MSNMAIFSVLLLFILIIIIVALLSNSYNPYMGPYYEHGGRGYVPGPYYQHGGRITHDGRLY